MKIITNEPSSLILDRIYSHNQTRTIIVNGQRGTITSGSGGWGEVAIRVTIGDMCIVARERESEDYDGPIPEDGCPNRLELYGWEIEDEDGYYLVLSDALRRRNPRGPRLPRLAVRSDTTPTECRGMEYL